MNNFWLKTAVSFAFIVACLSTVSAQTAKKDTIVLLTPRPPEAKPVTDTSKASKLSVKERIKGSRKIPGLFTLYQDSTTGNVMIYVKKEQLGKEYIYQSFSLNGPTDLGLNQSMYRSNAIIKVEKAFDKLEFAEVNTSFYYDKKNAISKTASVDIPEAVFLAEKYSADDTGYLISADGLFLSEKLDAVKELPPLGTVPGSIFGLGSLNTTKSKYYSIQSFPENTDVQVDLAYDNPTPYIHGGKDITDARYMRVRIQHSFIALPQNNFRPRLDDPRVGFFTEQINDQTSFDAVPYRDVIDRWDLVKKDPSLPLSEPVQPIVWWIENTTPVEYRSIIKRAGEKWNEAFEKAGFKNAIVMKQMPDDAGWNPSDIRYNVIRWVSSYNPPFGAIGWHFSDPRTGQILGGDITVEWFFGAGVPVIYDDLLNGKSAHNSALYDASQLKGCVMPNELKEQFIAGLTALETAGASEAEVKKLHEQFLYYLILHEMGHTLGLSHNMEASQMLKPSQLNDTTITHSKGLVGSVMEYPEINISSDRKKQGDFYITKPGPYDVWAIQYAYTPVSESEEQTFRKSILARSTEHDLAFGNDADDMRSPGHGIDPRVNIFDLSSDPIGYAEERFMLVNKIMSKLKDKYSKDGKGYAELRARYLTLNNQRLHMIRAIGCYMGGVYIDRSFVGQHSVNKPYTPAPIAVQKRALSTLAKYVFAPNAFTADTYLYPYLQPQRRGYDFFTTTEDPKLSNAYMTLATAALNQILHPVTMQRINNSRMYGNQYSLPDVMSDLSKAIFDKDLKGNVNVYRQYLQTSFVKSLAQIADPKSITTDDESKAAARYTLRKLKTKLATAVSTNEETKAHRNNLLFMVEDVLTVKAR
jgi:hypothetical protein